MQATQKKVQLMIKGEFKQFIKVARVLDNGNKQVIFRFNNNQGASLVKTGDTTFEIAHIEFLDERIESFELLDIKKIHVHESDKLNLELSFIKNC